MLRRKILDQLRQWLHEPERRPLIVEGPPRVGKTTAVRALGEQQPGFLEINLKEDAEAGLLFEGAVKPETFLAAVRLRHPGLPESGRLLIFLDELQSCPAAIAALGKLGHDSRYDLIAAARGPMTPGEGADWLFMTSLDFEEFLWALGVDEEIPLLLLTCFARREPVPPAIHAEVMRLLRIYLCVGGLPEAVNAYLPERDLRAADTALRQLLRRLLSGISQAAPPELAQKARQCYEALPRQLTGDNHKFRYSVVEDKGTARKFGRSLQWLESAHLTVPVRAVSAVSFPLKAQEKKDSFRLYPHDVGLLTCRYDFSLKEALAGGGTDAAALLLRGVQDGLWEALAADILYKHGYRDLHFYRSPSGTVECAFLLARPGGLLPVEVSPSRSISRSLTMILEKFSLPYGYRLMDRNVSVDGKKIILPPYMLLFV